MKQSLYLGKSYLVTNTIIGMNKIDNRCIVDEEDIKKVESIVKNIVNKKGFYIIFYDDIKDSNTNDDLLIRTTNDSKLYMKAPWITTEELTEKYRDGLPFGLSNMFEEIDSYLNMNKDITKTVILKAKEKRIQSEFPMIYKTKEPKVYKKEYRISEK